MTELNSKTYINLDNIVITQEVNGDYFIVLATGNKIAITKQLYDEIKAYEGGGGSGTEYTAGTGIDITDGVISNTQDAVAANPVVTEEAPELTSLKIGEIDYKLGGDGGKQLYQHNIYLNQYGLKMTLQIINDNNTQFTLSSLKQFLQTKNFVYNVNPYQCFGAYKPAGTEDFFNMLGMNGNDMYAYNNTTGVSLADSGGTFTDTVIAL